MLALGVIYLGVLAVILAVIAVPIIAIAVVTAVAARSRTAKSTARPQISSDGNWWWDGEKWIPIDQRPS